MDYHLRRGEFCGGGLHFILLRKNASTSISAALTASGKRLHGKFIPQGERVAVWRDPRDRLLSAWKHYSKRGIATIPAGMSFEEFIEYDDWHLHPQWPVLSTCDRVLLFERLEQDFDALRKDYPWIGPLPRLNVGGS